MFVGKVVRFEYVIIESLDGDLCFLSFFVQRSEI